MFFQKTNFGDITIRMTGQISFTRKMLNILWKTWKRKQQIEAHRSFTVQKDIFKNLRTDSEETGFG